MGRASKDPNGNGRMSFSLAASGMQLVVSQAIPAPGSLAYTGRGTWPAGGPQVHLCLATSWSSETCQSDHCANCSAVAAVRSSSGTSM